VFYMKDRSEKDSWLLDFKDLRELCENPQKFFHEKTSRHEKFLHSSYSHSRDPPKGVKWQRPATVEFAR
jgi:hypothetical protein